jgi:3,4-dihydroxyphenylacetate 2,3-dioxygenase
MINRLSHVEVAVSDLSGAREFYRDALGLTVYEQSAEAVWLRAPDEFDVWSLKLTRDSGRGLLTFGFRVDSEESLDALAAQHARLGIAHRWLAPDQEPGRGRTLRVKAPSGHVVDFQHEIAEVPFEGPAGVRLPMRSTHATTGVAPTRLDHINVRVSDIDTALAYWRDHLQFSASELHVEDGKIRRAWLRRAPFSHDIAMGRDEAPGFHHVAYAMRDSYLLFRAADVLADGGHQVVEYGPGRHGITDANFLYVLDPDGNRIELYSGDYVRDLDRAPVVWSGEEYERRGLLWWGQQPPASFLLAGPVLDRGLLSPEHVP